MGGRLLSCPPTPIAGFSSDCGGRHRCQRVPPTAANPGAGKGGQHGEGAGSGPRKGERTRRRGRGGNGEAKHRGGTEVERERERPEGRGRRGEGAGSQGGVAAWTEGEPAEAKRAAGGRELNGSGTFLRRGEREPAGRAGQRQRSPAAHSARPSPQPPPSPLGCPEDPGVLNRDRASPRMGRRPQLLLIKVKASRSALERCRPQPWARVGHGGL